MVPDARSYVAAVAQWTPNARFPVLIDDGSWRARENIGRFVRAFTPTQVVTWSGGDIVWSDKPAIRQAALQQALCRVWNSPSWNDLPRILRESNRASHGVIAADAADPAWPAALALAVGHAQPIAWVNAQGSVTGQMTMPQAMDLSRQITTNLDHHGWAWGVLGDEIDSVTLALNCPVRVRYAPPPTPPPPSKLGSFLPKQDEDLATTDIIGRETEGQRLARWAWCGQIIGSESESAYRAMCSLFLSPKAAALFDGYESVEPWQRFDITQAGNALMAGGFEVEVRDEPRQSLSDWQTLGTRGLSAGLVLINSSGMYWHFDLRPGRGLVGDVPMLNIPAIVSMVHSWSAWSPANRWTIGGRFIEHGAYAYVGSVHEPFLQAFVPTPGFAVRLLTQWPLGAAARLDNAPPWRITVIGDPLITLGAAAPRANAPLPLQGAKPIRDGGAADASPAALWALVMAGDDAGAIRRCRGAFTGGKAMSVEVALVIAMPAFRTGDVDLLCEAFRRALPQVETAPDLRDALWHALRPSFRTLTRERIALLALALREEQPGRDAAELYDLMAPREGKEAARAVLARLRDQSKNPDVKKAIDEFLAKAR